MHTRDMKTAYKQAVGRKLDNRRVLMDVERGRTVPNWRPQRLGGGLGLTRNGGEDLNQKNSGRTVKDLYFLLLKRQPKLLFRLSNVLVVMATWMSAQLQLLSDAKLYEIGAGTSEIRRLIIGRELFKERQS